MASPPYRDENASLRAENERLRAALGSRPRRPMAGAWLAAALCALDLAALGLLMPWLNGDDRHFWAALGIVVALAGFAVASAVLYKRT